MADAFVSALVTTVLGNLNSAALQQIGLAWGLDDELNNLESILGTVHLVLHDAEQKQRKNKVIQDWLRKLKHAASDAENIIEEISIEDHKRRVGFKRGMRSYLSSRNPLLFRFKIARKVKNIRERLDAIAAERHNFHLTEGVVENRVGGMVESRLTSSLVNEEEICGRKEDKEMIIETLIGSNTLDHDLSVYAIRGMGGLGKTTLAQLVYNDERVKRHFDLRIWVCVSNDFSIQRLVRAIIESIEMGGCNISELDTLLRYLQEKLRGKRFLLVLDDVWNENQGQWDGLKEALKCGSGGSMVMVTTRIEKVALMMATIPIHHLGYLSKDDSWSLFKQRAFTAAEREESLIAIGKAIVEKCSGLPLAIKTLGSLMRHKSTEREWLTIKSSEIWLLSEDESDILPALRLSYDNLPPHMRQCFAYCCIFPKDYEMNRNQLIELWMANGFLNIDSQTDLHLNGQLIFKELVWRSFFQDVENTSMGGVTCKMHDLMHDLAEYVMRHETYILQDNKHLKIPKMLSHLSLGPTSRLNLPLIGSNSLFSLIGNDRNESASSISSFLLKQRYLKVLHLNFGMHSWGSKKIQKLPDIICKLERLRYLAMPCVGRKRLPESLICLHYLQTLKLIGSSDLVELPKGLKQMKNLWFLDIEGNGSLVCMPPGLGELTFLQRLSIFIVGQDSETQIDQLKGLHLGGELSIRGLDNVRSFEDAKSANLISKNNLTCLSLSWTTDPKERSTKHFEEVLEGLQPCQNLEKINIKSYHGSRFPNWISSLACLTEICLEFCDRCESVPPFGVLPALKSLKLYEMDSVKNFNSEWLGNGEISFPALIQLTIEGMPNLEEWTVADSVESFPLLKRLVIIRCPKLKGLPFLPDLRNLEIEDSSVTLIGSIMLLTSLTSLHLTNFLELDALPVGLLQNHQALKVLKLHGFPDLKTLSDVLINKPALKIFEISRCSNLEFLPEGLDHLNSLEKLRVHGCDSLTLFPAAILEHLSSLILLSISSCKRLNPLLGPLQQESAALQHLDIFECPEFKYFPESMQQLTALKTLRIWNGSKLLRLPNWLGRLQSLSGMWIIGCKQLNCLPDGFQNLKSLKHLYLVGCDPQLVKRCEKPNGEDWPKISHIPAVIIN